jgi:hypothetical protein
MNKPQFGFIPRPVTGTFEFRSSSTVAETPLRSPIRSRSWRRWLAHHQAAVAATVIIALPALPVSGFTLTNVALPGVAYSSVVCGDFNNDGQPDVLVTGVDNAFNGISQVWQNYSNGHFTNLQAGLPGLSSSAVARGDFDNDGRIDLFLTGLAGVDANSFPIYLSQVWRNLGNGTFAHVQAGLPGVNTGAVALGDFDNDGNLDILLTGYSSTGAVAQVWRNLGNGAFTNINAGLPGVLYSAVALGDLDGDGWLDILLTGTPDGFGNTAISQLWRNQGNGTFARLNLDLPGISQGAVAMGDLDQDGRLDLVLTGYAVTGAVCQVWRNLGAGLFTNVNAGLPGVYQSSVALGDYDNDGQLDLAVAGMDSNGNPICQVWQNTGTFEFTNLNAGFPGVRSGSVVWADFDNDGQLDLLLAGLNEGGNPTLQVYRNNTASSSTSAPRINRLQTLANGGQELAFVGRMGLGYRVWASTNLVYWTALGAANEASPATFRFCDLKAANMDSRFYRLSQP